MLPGLVTTLAMCGRSSWQHGTRAILEASPNDQPQFENVYGLDEDG